MTVLVHLIYRIEEICPPRADGWCGMRVVAYNRACLQLSVTVSVHLTYGAQEIWLTMADDILSCLVFVFSNNRQSSRAEYCADGLGCAGSGELRCSRSRRTGRQACQVGLEGVSCSSCYNVGREGVPVTYGPMSYKVQ